MTKIEKDDDYFLIIFGNKETLKQFLHVDIDFESIKGERKKWKNYVFWIIACILIAVTTYWHLMHDADVLSP